MTSTTAGGAALYAQQVPSAVPGPALVRAVAEDDVQQTKETTQR